MTDTLSSFWHWFIVIPVVLGLIGCAWLVWGNSRGPKDETTETVGHVWDEDLEEYNNPLPRWWLNMFYITLIFGALYLVLYPGLGNYKGWLGWTQIQEYETELSKADERYGALFSKFAATAIPELAKDPEARASGARLFSTYCTTCHGSDARGAPGFPNLRDSAWLWGGSPQQVKVSILDGRNGVMPSWGAALQDVGVTEVVAYVQSLAGETHDSALAEKGKVRFTQFCVACHGLTGKGNPVLGAPNLTDDVWLYGKSADALTESIKNGRTGRMPPHREFLGEDKAHILAAYVWGLSQPTAAEKAK